MKTLFLFLSIAFINSFSNAQNVSIKNKNSPVPEELLTGDSTYWSITTVSSINYVNTTPGAYYNTTKSGGGMIVRFKFKQDGTYEFMLYVQANTYGIENETWTHTHGTVEFTTDELGQPIFRTQAAKGTYRITKNGNTTSRPIPTEELTTKFSNTYLWEKTKLKDDPNHIYLLMVNLNDHPGIDLKHPEKIDPGWVSKFHIPAKR
jgi:sarcosine oxidase delta subunit